MAEGQVTELYDLDAIRANKDEALNIVKAGVAEIKAIQATIGSNNSVAGSGENANAAARSMNNLTASLKEYIAQNERLIQTEAKLRLANSEDAKALAEYKTQLGEVNRQINEQAKSENVLYQERMKQAKAIKDANAAQKEAARLARENAAEQKIAAKNVTDLSEAYKILELRHKAAVKEYQNAAVAQRLSSQEIVALRDNANRLGDQLRRVDEGVGNYRRNVGNYSSAWNGLGNSIQQVARELPNFAQSMQLGFLAISNNLPILNDELRMARERIAALRAEGKPVPSLFNQISNSIVSWQTLMVIGITVLVKYGDQITKMISKLVIGTDLATRAQETLNKAYASSEITTAIANVNKLTEDIQLAKNGILDKTQVLKEYNETIGQVTGEVKNLDQAELELGKNANAYIQFTLLKAASNYALEESAKKSVEAIISSQKVIGKLGALTPGQYSPISASAILFGTLSAQNAKDESDDLLKIGENFREKAAELAKKNGFDFFGGKMDDKKKAVKKQQDLTNELLNARKKEIEEQRKLDIQRLQEEADVAQAIYENENKSYEERIHALDTYLKRKESIIKLTAESEQEEVVVSLDKIAQIEAKAAKDRTNEEKNLLLNKKNLQIQLTRLQEEEITKQVKNDLDGEKERLEITKDFSAEQLKIITARLNNIRLAGEQAGTREAAIIQNQIAYLSQLGRAYGLNAEGQKKLAEMITNFQIKQIKALETEEEAADRRRRQRVKAQNDYIKEIAKATFDFILQLLDQQAQEEIDRLEKTKEAVSEEYSLRQKAIEDSSLSEEEKTNRKLVLIAEEKEAQRQLDEQIRLQKRKQAELEKVQALATIAINAAVALASAQNLSLLGALSPFIIGLAAIQAAAVLAAPIPEYAEGRDKNDPYEGKAIAGEAGTELMIDRKGNMKLLTAPTLVDVMKGDTILSNEQLRKGEAAKYFPMPQHSNQDVVLALENGFEKLDRRMRNKRNEPIVLDRTRYQDRINAARA